MPAGPRSDVVLALLRRAEDKEAIQILEGRESFVADPIGPRAVTESWGCTALVWHPVHFRHRVWPSRRRAPEKPEVVVLSGGLPEYPGTSNLRPAERVKTGHLYSAARGAGRRTVLRRGTNSARCPSAIHARKSLSGATHPGRLQTLRALQSREHAGPRPCHHGGRNGQWDVAVVRRTLVYPDPRHPPDGQGGNASPKPQTSKPQTSPVPSSAADLRCLRIRSRRPPCRRFQAGHAARHGARGRGSGAGRLIGTDGGPPVSAGGGPGGCPAAVTDPRDVIKAVLTPVS